MTQDRESSREESSPSETRTSNLGGSPTDTGIGTGKKVGLYGIGFLLLGLIFVVVMIYVTGYYVPFEGTEGVGP